MDKIVLKFDAKELDYLLNLLAQRPFAEVQGLIQEIVRQANEQRPQPPQE